MSEIVSARDVNFYYKDKNMFTNLNFDIKKNSITSILGSNNSGKTTLIKMLAGILPSAGKIVINEIVLDKKNSKEILLNIGVIFSNVNSQFLFADVISELRFPLENLNYCEDEIEKRVDEITLLLGITNIHDEKIINLSNYERLLVLLAVSIIHKPKVLFIDDAFTNLTDKEKKEIFKLFNTLTKKEDLTVVFASSDLYITMFATNAIVINEGVVALAGVPDKILESDNELAKFGIEIPLIIDLCLKLKFYDLLDKIYLDVNKVVDQLWP